MRVRAKQAVYINGSYREEGAEFEYSGPEDVNLLVLGPSATPVTALAPVGVPQDTLVARLRAAGATGLPPVMPQDPPPAPATPETGVSSVRLPTGSAADGADLLS